MRNPANSYATSFPLNRFFIASQKILPERRFSVTFARGPNLLRGCVVGDQTKTQELASPPQPDQKLRKEKRLSLAALTGAAIQGLCVFAVAANSVKVALGIGSVAAGGGSSLIHSDPIRLTLRYVSAGLATATFYVIWNGWRLRNRTASQWRKVPLTKGQKWAIALGLFSSVASWFLIIAEVFAHQRMHPR